MSEGYKSSEFFVSLLALIVPAIIHALQGASDPIIAAIGGIVASAYTISRTQVKKANINSPAFDPKVFGAMLPSEKAAAQAAPAPVQAAPAESAELKK